ncbi:FRAS1-related extracellular matrix protein 1 [Saccoglossus kowalevskii]|uniref:FRAS1-related extracellular matrix protein 1 n=1 Tax=Saccoglossus kowalevskii TaxID=10224 RepID=A0ABM0M806_SACKO|nr:PREDICTED: FRAS1-related extracellular matrix protein 1 [Saccoglossus kowalevskii]
MLQTVFHLVTLLVSIPTVIGQLVAVNNGLTVMIGRTKFLDPADLTFNLPDVDEGECKVEVVLNEPMTQRVGVLTPQVFDCNFYSTTVQYKHNGSPILLSDTIKLKVYHLTDSQTQTQIFDLNIEIEKIGYKVFFPISSLRVEDFLGMSNTLDRHVLEFLYNRVTGASCVVTFSRVLDHQPQFGQLVTGDGEHRKVLRYFKESCDDFLKMGIRYEHLLPPSPDIDYVALAVTTIDPLDNNREYQEKLFLPVHIMPGFKNQKPSASFISMYVLDADEFVLTTITPFVLSSQDEETPNSQLVFNISHPLEKGQGEIVHLNDLSKPVTSFSQIDVDNFNIAYNPPNISYSERKVYNIELTVYDGYFEASEPIMLMLAVRSSSTNAPRVSLNKGLTMLEGQSRPITLENLQVVDNDNLKDVRLIVIGGLQHGTLKQNGHPIIMFTPFDLQHGTVNYYHDDSDSTRDKIELRLTDGTHSSRLSLPINILPKDDSPPFLITNVLFQLNEGETVLIGKEMLHATDADSSDDYITYKITQQPNGGEIIKKFSWDSYGHPVDQFTQKDLFRGLIYYRHLGQEIFQDFFSFVLLDSHVPPNESPEHSVIIHIESVDDLQPQPIRGTHQAIRLKETDINFIERNNLQYTDVESADMELVYTITTPPYFADTHSLNDAGRVFSTNGLTMLMKDPTVVPLRTFTQHEINHRKVAYMPPFREIGATDRQIQFIFSVSDPYGNTVVGQIFNITVLPVNNQSPVIYTSDMIINEGGSLIMGPSLLAAADKDTSLTDLIFSVERLPQYGVLEKDAVVMDTGDTFNIDDVNSFKIRYTHDGSEVEADNCALSISDGVQSTSEDIFFKIIPINDQLPQLNAGLNPNIRVPESGHMTLTPRMLSAIDSDTNDMVLNFIIVSPPVRGIMQRDFATVTTFTQRDIVDGNIRYVHTGGEIGPRPVFDRVTILVSDQIIPSTSNLPLHDLNITIVPINNQPPNILLFDAIHVPEGGKWGLTRNVLDVNDPDTDADQIMLIITSQPTWGYLENILPSPGHEKSNAGKRISSFSFKDVVDGNIYFMQSVHEGVEPTSDWFVVYADDGKNISPQVTLNVMILPQNDEVPNFVSNDITLNEGSVYRLDQATMNIVDIDVPQETLVVSISKQPEHGYVIDMSSYRRKRHAPGEKYGERQPEVIHEFTVDAFLTSLELVYQHDGSESTSDQLGVRLTDGVHTVRKTININIIPMNDEPPVVIKNTGVTINMHETVILSAVVLQARDVDTTDANLIYTVHNTPDKGILQVKKTYLRQLPRWEPVDLYSNFTQHDVNMNLLRYAHTGGLGSKANDKFRFTVTDGKHTTRRETFDINILNTKKDDIMVTSGDVEVGEGNVVVITTDTLSASDNTNLLDEIVFTVVDPPTEGQIEEISHPGIKINSFTLLDLVARTVVYKHMRNNGINKDSMNFIVSNGLSSRNGTLRIHVIPIDDALPIMYVNTDFAVDAGSARLLTESDLLLVDPDSDNQELTYIVIKPPEFGHLLKQGQPVHHKFTQTDINNLHILYKQDGGRSREDAIFLIASDNTNAGFIVDEDVRYEPIEFRIQINAVRSEYPHIINNQPATTLDDYNGRYGYTLTNFNLKVMDKDSLDSNIIYVVTRLPLFGYLEFKGGRQFFHRTFTQEDVNNLNVIYFMHDELKQTNDSFEFEVHDSHQNKLSNQRFDLHWTIIQMVRAEYVVCENIGTLSVNIQRLGHLAESSFITVKVKGVSATYETDFVPSTAELIQFDPGVAIATWNVLIVDDGLEENEERFRVMLKSPINAILGDNEKATVLIVDSRNGQCDSGIYPDIISKSPDRSADSVVRSDDTSRVGSYVFQTGGNKAQVSSQVIFSNATSTVWRNHGLISVRTDQDSPETQESPGVPDRLEGSILSPRITITDPRSPQEQTEDKETTVIRVSGPSRCNESSVGVLHFDTSANKMYQCDGYRWIQWSESETNKQKSNHCNKGWSYHKNLCYRVGGEEKTWNDAQRTCRELYYGNLPSVSSNEDQNWLWVFAGGRSVWIGLNDKYVEGNWEWIDGSPLTFTSWKRGNPKPESPTDRNCAMLGPRLRWQDKHCDRVTSTFVCAVPTTRRNRR